MTIRLNPADLATTRSDLGLAIGTDVLAPNGSGANLTNLPTTVLPSLIGGIVPSNNSSDGDHDLDFTAGVLAPDDTAAYRSLGALTKRFDTAFAAGTNAGALGDSQSLPTSGTMHVFAISKDSDASMDIMGDTSASGANVPSGYTVERRIFSFETDGSANILAFTATEISGGGIRVEFADPTLDVDVSNLGTSSVSYALSTPSDIKTEAIINAYTPAPPGAPTIIYIRSLAANDEAPSTSSAPLVTLDAFNGTSDSHQTFNIMTNTSSQIAARTTGSNETLRVATFGYIDHRR